jgi:acyl carrier protein
MVPSAYVFLEALPLASSGKVDRKALPAPEWTGSEASYVAPRTPTEEILAGIWAEVLKLERVGIHDNFFELGGHSLLATQAVSRASEKFELRIPLKTIFDEPTLAGFSDYIATLGWSRQHRQEVRNVEDIERFRI